MTVTLDNELAILLLTVNEITYVPGTSATKVGIASDWYASTALVPGGREVNIQLYVSVPIPLGFIDPLPSSVTVVPIVTVRLGPGFATGAAAVLWNVHCSFEKSNGTKASVRIVNVFPLATWLFAPTGAKLNVPCPGAIRTVNGSSPVSVAVTAPKAGPTFTRSARYVTAELVPAAACLLTNW